MSTYNDFLLELSEYPFAYQIDEASNHAQEKANEYLQGIDKDAESLTVEDGEVYFESYILDEDQKLNVQVIFDESFSEKILSFGYHY